MEDLDPTAAPVRVAMMNPSSSGQTANFGWNGRWMSIAPGEIKLMAPWLAQHAQKSNPFLIAMDAASSQDEFARAEVEMAEKRVLEQETILRAQTEQLKAEQIRLAQAKNNQRAKEQEAEQQRKANQEALEAEQKLAADRAAAAKKAALKG